MLPHDLNRRLPVAGALDQRKKPQKNSSRKNPRNPLKSLASDERIQGNPRKSNPQKQEFLKLAARSQENPNGSIGPISPTPPGKTQADACPEQNALSPL
jgi:hypothetical protein